MGIPNLADLSVVMDPLSRESGLDMSLGDAVLEIWRRRRAARHRRRAFAAPLRKAAKRQAFIALPVMASAGAPCSWSGDIARPGR